MTNDEFRSRIIAEAKTDGKTVTLPDELFRALSMRVFNPGAVAKARRNRKTVYICRTCCEEVTKDALFCPKCKRIIVNVSDDGRGFV